MAIAEKIASKDQEPGLRLPIGQRRIDRHACDD